MFISHKLKLIFSHIPKTAGASFKACIKRLDKNSKEIGNYHGRITRNLRNKYKNYKTITIVRNSYKAVVSRYRFEQIVYKRKGKILRRNFKQYILTKKLKVFNQLKYIFTKGGYKLIDYVLHYETLEKDIKNLGKKLNIKFPKLPKTIHNYGKYNYKDYYNKETLNIVKKKCKKDIEYFKWKYED